MIYLLRRVEAMMLSWRREIHEEVWTVKIKVERAKCARKKRDIRKVEIESDG